MHQGLLPCDFGLKLGLIPFFEMSYFARLSLLLYPRPYCAVVAFSTVWVGWFLLGSGTIFRWTSRWCLPIHEILVFVKAPLLQNIRAFGKAVLSRYHFWSDAVFVCLIRVGPM